MKKFLYLLVLIPFLSGCTNSSDEPTIMTTVKPLTDLTSEIVGDNFIVKSIYPNDSDAHHYELTAKNMSQIADSDMFIYISDSNNGFSADLQASGEYNTKFVSITQDQDFKANVDSSLYTDESLLEDEHEENSTSDKSHEEEHIDGDIMDPHVWVSPKKLMLISNVITENVSKYDPEHKAEYEANNKAVQEKLAKYDKEYTEFAKEQKYPIIVSHDAYNYLNLDYGIKSTSLYGLVHDDEPTASEIKDIINMINKQNIPAIYVEQNDQNNKVIQQIADETGAQIRILNNMASQSSSDDSSVYGLLEANLEALSILKK